MVKRDGGAGQMNTNAVNNESTDANQAHQEYLAEARRLVDDQIEALFALIARAAARATTEQQPAVTRSGHTLRVSNGVRTAAFEIEAITDLPEGADRAQAFPAGQARCTMRGPEGVIEEYELHRAGEGAAAPGYAWMYTKTQTPVGEEDIARSLQALFAA
jgi:hypothetical protein